MHGKTILLGVSGSIAAYKACELASRLTQQGAQVPVVLTSGAQKFVAPLTFQALTQQPVHTSLWPQDSASEAGVSAAMAHIGLAENADAILIAPASASCIAKLAGGIADDLLGTLVLAARCPVLIAPAMNPAMWEHPATQRNLETLRGFRYHIIEPESGRMACEHIGQGRLPETEVLLENLRAVLEKAPQILSGKRVLITAGPTREMLDPVRFLSNRSSGQMGYALAQTALARGAEVVLISGPTRLAPPRDVQLQNVTTTEEMYHEVLRHAPGCDIIVAAAAPCDFRPAQLSPQKIKKQGDAAVALQLVPTPDIIGAVGAQKHAHQIIIAFAAETENVLAQARRKMSTKNADAIVANDVTEAGAGFDVPTNRVTWITPQSEESWPLMGKDEVSAKIWDKVVALSS